jgi:anti-sigma regulatory factor (Ser/Thr protein kinase)
LVNAGSVHEWGIGLANRRPGDGVTAELKLRIAGGPGAASAARRALDSLQRHLHTRLLDDIRLLVSELVTNSIRHAGVGPSESVELDVAVATDKVRVAVSDLGPGFEPDRAAEPGSGGGWGLFMVETVSDRWGVDGGSDCRVWFEIDRRGTRFARTG